MGERGPVPKRSDQRHGHRKNEPGDTAPAAPRAAYRPPSAKAEWHPLAQRWWRSLAKSAQSFWYQPSDWEHAYVWAHLLSQQLESGKPSAMMLAAWDSASARLLVTEGDRRRVRIELDNGGEVDADKEAAVASMQAWRAQRASGS